MLDSQNREEHGGGLKLHRTSQTGEVSFAPQSPKVVSEQRRGGPGALAALSYLTIGGAPDLPRASGRGGARNRRDRTSHNLSVSQVGNLVAAARHAEAVGLPFTRMTTIHWEAAGVPLDRMAHATGRFVGLLAKALARHDSKTAWLWTHEGGDGKGGHCHLLAHVPAKLVSRVTALQRGWLRRITGRPYRARVVLSRPIGGRLNVQINNPSIYAVNLDAATSYILKGASPKAAERFGLEKLESGGRVIGKRCGTSQNIGAKARRERAIP
jgi:hypothetical protein